MTTDAPEPGDAHGDESTRSELVTPQPTTAPGAGAGRDLDPGTGAGRPGPAKDLQDDDLDLENEGADEDDSDEYDYDEEDDEEGGDYPSSPFDLLGGGAGMGGFGGLLSQLGRVRETVQNAQDAADTEIEGSAGGGAVRILGTAGLDFRSVVVDPSVAQGDDPDLLPDLLLAALRDFADRAREVQRQAMGDFGGMDFGGLFGG